MVAILYFHRSLLQVVAVAAITLGKMVDQAAEAAAAVQMAVVAQGYLVKATLAGL
jgi:hypothetical protein